MSKTGAQAYMAPEMFKQHSAGTSADVWSFGVLLFECMTGEVRAPSTPIAELKQQLAEAGCGKELVELFEQCRHPDEPEKRATMAAIHDTLQKLVMQASSDDRKLRLELKRARARDRDTYDLTWAKHYAVQPHIHDLLTRVRELDKQTRGHSGVFGASSNCVCFVSPCCVFVLNLLIFSISIR